MGYPSLSYVYQGGTALRDKVASDVMTTSDEPLELSMDLHTEMSYLPHWPSKLEIGSSVEYLHVVLIRNEIGGVTGYEVTWNDDNTVTLYATLPATINHPTTGEELWFNQITSSHSSYFKVHPAFMNEEKAPTKYPLHTSYGDGEEFTDDEISHMRILQWNKAVGFQWQTSDVLVVDNLTTAHGRIGATFDSSQRKILASLLDN
ncbi:dapdiamide synthesis protein DdaC-like [Glandiceps talaboti]